MKICVIVKHTIQIFYWNEIQITVKSVLLHILRMKSNGYMNLECILRSHLESVKLPLLLTCTLSLVWHCEWISLHELVVTYMCLCIYIKILWLRVLWTLIHPQCLYKSATWKSGDKNVINSCVFFLCQVNKLRDFGNNSAYCCCNSHGKKVLSSNC